MATKFLQNLSGGMNEKSSDFLRKDTQWKRLINYNLDTLGAITKRAGYSTFLTQPIASRRMHGLFQYTNTSVPAETTQVMVINNAGNTQSVIYYNDGSAWQTSKTNDTVVSTFTNFNRARFATFLDYLFRVNGVDAVATSNNVNGSSWGTTIAPATITPSFIAVFQDRVYLARNGVAAGSRVFFSQLPAAGVITWDTSNDFFDVNPDDGDEINALENNGNRLLIFKKRSLYRWNFGQTEPDRLLGVGVHSQECVKTNLDLGITFFANEYGAYAYSGERPKLISRGIEKWFRAIPAADLDDMAGETDDDHYYLYMSDSMTVDGVTYTNVMAVYTISLNAWSIYSLHTPVRVMAKLILSSSEDIHFGSSNGRAYKFNDGRTDNSGGAAGATAVAIHTEAVKEQLLTFPRKGNLEYIDVLGKNAFTTQVAYQLDGEGKFIPLGNVKNRFNAFQHIGKQCNSVAIRFSDSGLQESSIEAINIEYEPIRARP